MTHRSFLAPRSVLYLPASNARAIEKARTLDADMVILDLEDAVKPEDKDAARDAAVQAVAQGFGDRITAIRLNGVGSEWHQDDRAAIAGSAADMVVVPKVETVTSIEMIAGALAKPVLAMIETPLGILNAVPIAAAKGVAGLIAGTNDIANALHLPSGADRAGLILSLQMIILAARAAGIWALDGVYNDLADGDGLEAQCSEGHRFGFDGKTLIHPSQIACANHLYSPTDIEIEDACALIAAASGGAERFRDRMIESMHVEMARRLLARAS